MIYLVYGKEEEKPEIALDRKPSGKYVRCSPQYSKELDPSRRSKGLSHTK